MTPNMRDAGPATGKHDDALPAPYGDVPAPENRGADRQTGRPGPPGSAPDALALDRAIAARVRAIRLDRGLSQIDIAQHLGVSFQQVQTYERGINRMSVSAFVKVAGALSVSPAQLLDVCLRDRQVGSADEALQGRRASVSRVGQTMELRAQWRRACPARHHAGCPGPSSPASGIVLPRSHAAREPTS